MAAWGPEEFQQQIDAACEGDWTVARLTEIGERVWNLERLFNLRAGLTAADDSLPERMLKVPAPERDRQGARLQSSSTSCCPSTTSCAAGRRRACPATRPFDRLKLQG